MRADDSSESTSPAAATGACRARADSGLAERDARLLRVVDAALDEAARRAGAHLACHRGCAVCCFGPFPITSINAWRLARGLAELVRTAPASASAIVERARVAIERLAPDFPGDAASGELHLAPQDEAGYAHRHAALPCPVLDPESGACSLYEHRPVACRLNGPPLALAGDALPPCPLCFRGAGPEIVEACRVTLDPGTAASQLTEAWSAAGGAEVRTLVAFAVVQGCGTGSRPS